MRLFGLVRLSRLTLAAVLLMLLGACTTGGIGGPSPGPTRSLPTTQLEVGQTLTTSRDNRVTVYRIELPLRTKTPPPSGSRFAAADVGGCAGANPPASTGITPQLFFLETRSAVRTTAWQAVDPLKRPALEVQPLGPNECARGWVTFRIPASQQPLFVSYIGSEIGRWRIP